MRKIDTTIPPLGAAVAGDQAIGEAPYDGRVTSVTFTPEAAIAGVVTNNRKLAVVNKGQDGLGNVEVAGLTFAAGVNAAAFDEKDITLSATIANRSVKAGDVLAVVETVNGTGLANPGGHVEVEVSPAG